MSYQAGVKQAKRIHRFVLLSAAGVTAVGLSGLAGWNLQVPLLLTWGGATAMAPNTAACFLLAGISLWLQRKRKRRFFSSSIARVFAGMISLLAVLVLAEHWFPFYLDVNRYLLVGTPALRMTRLRPVMSPITASALLLVSLALHTLDGRVRRKISPAEFFCYGGVVTALFGMMGLILAPVASPVRLAIPTVTTLSGILAGLLFCRHNWTTGLLLSAQAGGSKLLKKALLSGLIMLGLLGALISQPLLASTHINWVVAAALIILAAAMVAFFIGWIAFMIDRAGKQSLDQLVPQATEAAAENRLERRVKRGIALALLLTSLVGWLAWRMAKQNDTDAAWVAHTYRVSGGLESALTHLDDVETTSRGFALTGAAEFLAAFAGAKRDEVHDLTGLQQLVADNARQERCLARLVKQSNARIEAALKIIAARQNTRQVPPPAQIERGNDIMLSARSTIAEMQAEEENLLAERIARARATRQYTTSAIELGSLFGIIFLSIGGISLHREIRIGARSKALVRSLNADLEQRVSQRTAQLHTEFAARMGAEAQLRASEESLRMLLDGIKDYAVYMLDDQGRVASWNSGAARIKGYRAEEILGRHLSCFYNQLDCDRHRPQQALEKARLSGRFEEEGLRVRKDGSEFWAEVVITPMYESSGSLRGYSKVARDISQRRQAEEQLQKQAALLVESEGRLAGIIASAMDSIITVDESQLIVMFNAAAETMFRCPASETIGRSITRFIPQRFHAPHAAHIAHFDKTGVTNRVMGARNVLWAVRADGEEFRIEASISQVVTGGKKLFTVILRDVTERVQSEVMRERLAAIVDSSDDAIISKTLEGIITAWNSGAEKAFGYSAAEAMGKPMLMLLPAERVEEEHEILARIRSGRSVEHFETLRVRKDGTRISVSVTISPIRDSHGVIVGASKIARDITERKRSEQRLAEQAAQLAQSREALKTQTFMLQSVLNSMAEGLVAADEKGNFLLWNPAAETILGQGATHLPPAQWSAHYGTYLADKITPVASGQTPLERAIRGETSNSELFLRRREPGGEAWIEINGAPLRDHQGMLRGGVVAFRDITRRKADELEIRKLNEDLEEKIAKRTAQLAAANRELEAFSYSVSHDLRTPMRHIAGFSSILVREFGDGMEAEAREHLQRIEHAVLRMGQLVDALLKMATLRRQSLRLHDSPLNPIVEQVIALLQPECEGRQVEWHVAALPALHCDPVLIAQVFQNLLSNALKYSRGRSTAVIEVASIQQAGLPAVVFVRDNGAGFDMHYSEKLFGMFQRLHTEAEFEGTGVGLATVHRIIDKHRGLIWAEAEPGRGACFYFALQVNEDAAVALKTAMAKQGSEMTPKSYSSN